jgi:2-oxoglutarate dehydrogenase E1 component
LTKNYDYVQHTNPEYIEKLYVDYKTDPLSVDESWRLFFQGYEFSGADAVLKTDTADDSSQYLRKENHVLNLITAYRTRGHLFTKTNPVRVRRKYEPDLNISNFNLSENDLDTVFQAGNEIGIGPAKLRDIIDHLYTTYCESIGAEYMFIRKPERLKWLQKRMESDKNQPNFSIEKKKLILQKLNQAVVFENFLHTKFVGQKRFSLQGGETLIPGLQAIIDHGSEVGMEEFIIGMPHRGRLNVLANILNKEYKEIFAEFEGKEYQDSVFAGDVKYHLGYSGMSNSASGKQVIVGLAPNPSHLEAVNSVVEGMVKAKIVSRYDGKADKIMPILIHGDAAISAQGIVYEVIQMSILEGYKTGGTIHLVVNNQLGFTTNYLDGRSSTYCTDIAKVTLSPVFHVNGDDVEAVVKAIEIAVDYRQTFHTDVFIDLKGYRKYGHNEGDEPRFTQPKLYKAIAIHDNPRKIYNEKLLAGGKVEKNLAKEMEKEYREMLQQDLADVKTNLVAPTFATYLDQCDHKKRFSKHKFDPKPQTAVTKKNLDIIAEKAFTIPAEINPINKISKIFEERLQKYKEGKNLDWAIGELLAYGSLVNEEIPVRLSGQDSERGTFSHRHSVVLSEKNEQKYIPLNHINKKQADFSVYNSLLSEYGVLGFEYGYACAIPSGLTIWEAQFGDFNNGAQIIIDQYIASSEIKWNRTNGIVLYLPHGYEGQGPEHSSARIERFLQLCANDNMRITNCTTPANFFHLLRTQPKYAFRVPLVIFTPKSLLRHPLCVSPIEDFTKGQFQEVIDDPLAEPAKIKKVLFCSGKIYFDLLSKKTDEKISDTAIVRLEQLYPLPENQITDIIKKYKNAKKLVWVQEEPANAGALGHLLQNFKQADLEFISRDASATTATGFFKSHIAEQKKILTAAFKKV